MYLAPANERYSAFRKLLSRDLLILAVSFISMLLIIIPIWLGHKYEILRDGPMKTTLRSEVVHISSVALLTSTIPVLFDVVLDVISISRGFHMNPNIIMRIIIGLTSFLISLQLVVIRDHASIFALTIDPEYSFLLTIYGLRIMVISASLYNLTVSNSAIFKFEWTFFLTLLTCVFTVIRCYSLNDPYITQICGIGTLAVYFVHALTILFWTEKLVVKCRQSLSLENYGSLLYLFMYSIVVTASLGPAVENYFENGKFNLGGISSSRSKSISYFLYAHTFLAFFMMIVPGRLARYEAYLNMAHVVRTKTEYIRYISHEMRTPMNTVFLGLNLAMNQLPEPSDAWKGDEHRETLQEISSACKAALDILNELLLYDKLESGMLVLNKTDVKVPSLIYDAVSMFSVQLREKQLDLMVTNNIEMTSQDKGLTVNELSAVSALVDIESAEMTDSTLTVFQMEDTLIDSSNSTHNVTAVPPCSPTPILYDDMIHIDQYKIIQVIRNIISNAIKFTPMNGKIHVNMKFEPMEIKKGATRIRPSNVYPGMYACWTAVISSMIQCVQQLRLRILSCFQPAAVQIDFVRVDTSRLEPYTRDTANGVSDVTFQRKSIEVSGKKAIHGYLVIEITDTGAGISEENQKKLFHEIIQFQPEVLQHGGGSGLGMWISKSIVDLHQGHIQVYSPGEGCGATFTLKLPMIRIKLVDNDINTKKIPSPLYMKNVKQDSYKTVQPNDIDTCEPCTIVPTNEVLPRRGSLSVPTIDLTSKTYLDSTVTSRFSDTQRTEFPTPSTHTTPLTTERTIRNTSPRVTGQKSLKFLVVDDSSMNRKMLCRLLKSLGHTCDEANDGVEAVRLIKSSMQVMRRSSSRSISGKFSHDIPLSGVEDSANTGIWSLRTSPTINSAFSSTPRSATSSVLDNTTELRKSQKIMFGLTTIRSTHDSKSNEEEISNTSSHSYSNINICPTMIVDMNDVTSMQNSPGMNTYTCIYDAVTMDFMMPNMDGPTATAEIRKLGYTGPIIGVTGNALPSDIDYFKEKGATSVLVKPIEIDALQAVLKKQTAEMVSRESCAELSTISTK